jgi:hypothetical protein
MKFKIETPFWRMSRGHFVMFRFYTEAYKVSLSLDKRPLRWERCLGELIVTFLFIRVHYLRGNFGKV